MNNRVKVLTIDDEIEFCKVIKLGLEATKKFEVITASKAREGLRLAKTQKPDIILLDIMMPELTGTEIAEELLETDLTRNIPIIFVTALIKKDEQGDQYGNQSRYQVIAKPVNLKDLAYQIENALMFEKSKQS